MKTNTKVVIFSIVLILSISIILASCGQSNLPAAPENVASRTYDCDYHSLAFKTKISFTKDSAEYEISGNFLRFLTDPLTLYKNGEVIGSADDSYHVVNQDDHSIVINGNFEIAVVGNFEVFGNSYELYKDDEVKAGSASFNTLCTSGSITDTNGNLVAVYEKNPLLNDYTVTIYDNEMCSDEAILMIVASYVSDYHADNDD